MKALPQLRVRPEPGRRGKYQIEKQEGAGWRAVVSGLSEKEATEILESAMRKRIANAE